MADGFALIEINFKGQGRIKEVNIFDYRLENADFDSDYILETLIQQIPTEISDSLVLATFNYRCNESYDWWSGATEYEDEFNLESHLIVKTDYKEFWREMITASMDDYERLYEPDEEYLKFIKEDIAEWEEFYNEDYKPFKKRLKIK